MKKLRAFQGLRVGLTLAIFLFHSGFLIKGTFPVTFFFMLSGFLMYYTKYQTIRWDTGFKQALRFYPLHFLTFIIAVFVGRVWEQYPGSELIKSGILNLLLVHIWVPKYAMSYNAVTWYLSITVFLYLISFPLVKIVSGTRKRLRAISFLILTILAANVVLGYWNIGLYLNPLYRVLDYLLGMYTARLFLDHKDTLKIKHWTEIEYLLLFIFAVQYLISLLLNLIPKPGYYSIVFAGMLFAFAMGKGNVSKLLSLELFDKLAVMSFPFYMFHELVLRFFRMVFASLYDRIPYIMLLFIISVPSFFVTIGCTYIYTKIGRRRKVSGIKGNVK